jgi:hypothetical protein
MAEISNVTLAALLVISIIVSLGGTFLAADSSAVGPTGLATGIAKVNVSAVVAISLPVSTVDFGDVYQGYAKNTTTNSPAPLTVQNDGGVLVNVSIARDASSSPLFSGTGGGDNTASFQFKADNSTEAGSFNYALSTTTWTNVPGPIGLGDIIAYLNYSDTNDLAEVDLLISVPSDEPIGSKNETLVFTATLA